jgi:hypothetical protein
MIYGNAIDPGKIKKDSMGNIVRVNVGMDKSKYDQEEFKELFTESPDPSDRKTKPPIHSPVAKEEEISFILLRNVGRTVAKSRNGSSMDPTAPSSSLIIAFCCSSLSPVPSPTPYDKNQLRLQLGFLGLHDVALDSSRFQGISIFLGLPGLMNLFGHGDETVRNHTRFVHY